MDKLNSKQKKLESKEARMFLKFLEGYPPTDATLERCEMLQAFLQWLKKNGYIVKGAALLFINQRANIVSFMKINNIATCDMNQTTI